MERDARRGYAARAALTYAFIAGVYIVGSDYLVRILPLPEGFDPQTVKGLAFVAVTAVVYWLSARRWVDTTCRLEDEVSSSAEAVVLAETVVDGAPVGIVVSDLEGVVQLWNPKAEEILGWSSEEAVGMRRPGVSREGLRDIEGFRDQLVAGDSRSGVETVRIHRDGHPINVSVSNAPLFDADGNVTGVLVFFEDITDRMRSRRELAEAERLSDAKSDFLASMSHELRTPLNSIIGFSEIVRSGAPGEINAEQERQLGMVVGSARHLLELINDVLDLSRIESGQAVLHTEEVELCSIIEPLVESLTPIADDKGLALDVDCPDERLRLVTDVGKTRQILFNLVGNAVKFTQEGEVSLTVTADSDWITFRVQDTGPGIPSEDIPHLVEDFFRGRRPDPTRPKGTGLGLAISSRLIDLLGGALTIESEVGHGSVFTFTLPQELGHS